MFTPKNTRDPDRNFGDVRLIRAIDDRRPPPCECPECRQQFRTMKDQIDTAYVYKEVVNWEKASEICVKLAKSIQADRTYIREKLASHGQGIRKRWRDAAVKKRELLLLKVGPSMHDKKWNEFWFAYEWRYSHYGKEARQHRDIHLVPYLNTEALKEAPSRLPNLMESRARYSPEEWARFDSRLLTFPWTAACFNTIFSPYCVVLHGEKYGEVVPWDRDAAHRWDIVGFPRGHLILEAQAHIMKVLRGMAELLSDGLAPGALPAGELLLDFKAGLKPAAVIDFTASYLNEPYASNPRFDIEKLHSIVQTRLNLSEDHIWQLQTDPTYLRRYVKIFFEGAYCKGKESHAYADTTMDLDYDAWTARHWSWVLEEVENLRALRSRFQDYINPGHPLPSKYNKRLRALEVLIVDLMDTQSRHIQAILPQRPGFQHLYEFDFTSKPGCGGVKLKDFATNSDREAAGKEHFFEDPLHYSLGCLTTDVDAIRVVDHSRLFEFLEEHLTGSSAKERARVDEPLYRKISDLAAINEILVMIRSHRPKSSVRELDEIRKAEPGRAWRYIGKRFTGDVYGTYGEDVKCTFDNRKLQECPLEWMVLGQHLGAFVKTPEPNRNEGRRVWLSREIAQRKALSAFWENARSQHAEKLKRFGLGKEDIEYDLKILSADEHPDHHAALQTERQEILATLKNSTAPSQLARVRVKKPKRPTPKGQEGLVEPVLATASVETPDLRTSQEESKLSKSINQNIPIQTEWGHTPENIRPSFESKTKPKTRPSNLSIEQDLKSMTLNADSPSPDPNTSDPKVIVKEKALGIFRSLFPHCEGGTKSVAWDSFVDAMAKVGFEGRRSGGSAVLFEPNGESKWYGKGKIAIHRPHPDSTIDPVMLLSIGKRMKKWFGWSRDSFSLETKQK